MERFKIIGNDEPTEGCGPGCGCQSAATTPAPTDVDGRPRLELDEVRQKLSGQSGRRFWKSLDELARTREFEEMLDREFPRQAFEFGGEVDRRRFLQLGGASLALAGMTACTRQPTERLVPYVEQPEQIVPGQPLYFATGFPMGGFAQGVLVESHVGRPTKIEGNPDHPANPGGGTDLFAQASVLQLYDPDRSDTVTHLGRISSWDALGTEVARLAQSLGALRGAGLRFLTGTVTSPTLAAQLRALLEAMPDARWHQYDPAGLHNAFEGASRAFGAPAQVRYDLSRADVVLSLDSDFLTQGPGAVANAHAWAARRGPASVAGEGGEATTNRLYAVESTPSNTGGVADHRLALAPSEIARFALALAAELGVGGSERLAGDAGRWVSAVAADLLAHRGRAAVVAGDSLPAPVHVLVHAINERLGALGATVVVTEPVAADPVDQLQSITELTRDLEAGDVDTLVILGANPVFDAPADLAFAQAMRGAARVVHMGLYHDETADASHWHVPLSHYLESWSDVRSFDGTATIIQPLIEPLFQSRTAHELVALFAGEPGRSAYELVREHWQGRPEFGALEGGDFDRAWQRALHDGLVAGTEAAPLSVAGVAGVAEAITEIREGLADQSVGGNVLEVVFRADPTVHDGSWVNNGWLQECPKPVTKLTWDNAALVSPATAERLGFELRDSDVEHERPMLAFEISGRTVELPVWQVPGHADDTVTLHFGHGRWRAGQVGNAVGFDVFPVRTTAGFWHATAAVTPGTGVYPLATTQHHHSMHGRGLVKAGTVEQYRENPNFAHEGGHGIDTTASLYPGFEYNGHKWGLAVDLNACTGCNACVIACQSENNVPVVGKEGVLRGREMHWIRIDRYYEGSNEHDVVAMHNQPVLCMHCEQAPCEPVCPVAATAHSEEGLNDMVYNRCVGTRYCSNNCPYKVRRFNFLKYTDHTEELLKMVRNPDVTVRMRGVMEKCTYCVQRIAHARIKAKVDAAGDPERSERVRDGDVQTACQQACPSRALVFGDLNDPDAAVTRRTASPLNYSLLEELGTRPRTTYLAKLRNPNPALETERNEDHGSH